MNCRNFIRLVFENLGRPERPVDAGTEILELRGQTAVDYVDVAEE